MDAGSAALPSGIKGCGPVVPLLALVRLLTTAFAMEKKGSRSRLLTREDGIDWGGGRDFEVRTEYSVALSSSIVCARVPSSQLYPYQFELPRCGYTHLCRADSANRALTTPTCASVRVCAPTNDERSAKKDRILRILLGWALEYPARCG